MIDNWNVDTMTNEGLIEHWEVNQYKGDKGRRYKPTKGMIDHWDIDTMTNEGLINHWEVNIRATGNSIQGALKVC